VNLYGLIIGIAAVIGIEYFSKNNRIIPKNRENIFLFGLLISGLLGARIYHVIDQWSYYRLNPNLILQTWRGGLAIYGAILAMGLFTFIFCRILNIKVLTVLNLLTPILPLCQSIGRLGNFVNHEIPTWWLEASLNFILFFFLRKSKTPTAHYLIGYGVIRFFIEFLRTDTWEINNLKIAQIISLASIITGLLILKKFRRVGN
jgi:phosphatidylglycerol---prolipoprotein diacylglyceryl transferase